MQKTGLQAHIHTHKRKFLIHDFNIEKSFCNGDIKDREIYRRTTNILKGFVFLHDIKNIMIIFRQECYENYNIFLNSEG